MNVRLNQEKNLGRSILPWLGLAVFEGRVWACQSRGQYSQGNNPQGQGVSKQSRHRFVKWSVKWSVNIGRGTPRQIFEGNSSSRRRRQYDGDQWHQEDRGSPGVV